MDPVSEWFGGDAPELVLQRALGRPVRIERLVPGPVRQDRRALFRATLSGGEVVGVKFRRRRLRQVFDDWRRLSAGPGGFRVPAPIGLVEPPGCIVFRGEEGRRLIDTLRSEGEGAAWAGMAGRALVALHDSAVRLA